MDCYRYQFQEKHTSNNEKKHRTFGRCVKVDAHVMIQERGASFLYVCNIPILSLPASVNQNVLFAPAIIPNGKLLDVGMG